MGSTDRMFSLMGNKSKGREPKWLAVSWFPHRRMSTLCKSLNVELAVLETKKRGLLRYVLLSCRTIACMAIKKPQNLIVQNPSIGTAVLCVLMRPIFRYRVIIDAHNEAVVPFLHDNSVVRRIARWLLRQADTTIVTNEALASRVVKAGGSPVVLWDRVPEMPAVEAIKNLGPGAHALVVCTYAADEPIVEIVRAATAFQSLTLHLTGRCPSAKADYYRSLNPRIIFTGFLPDYHYWELLASVDFVIDLTTMPECLVCGAYEALAANKACLLADDTVARDLFGQAAVYTRIEIDAIGEAIGQMIDAGNSKEELIARHRYEMNERWGTQAAKIKNCSVY